MTDIKLFSHDNVVAQEIPGSAAALEKPLQILIERNLESLLGIRFLATEYETSGKQPGRIDTLGIDENSNPVIIEYKRATNQNVINQGLFYFDWLDDHRAAFELLVQKKLGRKVADAIDWSAPRLLCIAGGFTRYDENAIQQMSRNIELIRYKNFGENLLMLELVNASQSAPGRNNSGSPVLSGSKQKTASEIQTGLSGPLLDLYQAIEEHLMALGDDVQKKMLKHYIAFKRLKNFACVVIHPVKKTINIYLNVDPGTIKLERGFSHDVRKIGHHGTGDLKVTIRSSEDLENARILVQKSYDET